MDLPNTIPANSNDPDPSEEFELSKLLNELKRKVVTLCFPLPPSIRPVTVSAARSPDQRPSVEPQITSRNPKASPPRAARSVRMGSYGRGM